MFAIFVHYLVFSVSLHIGLLIFYPKNPKKHLQRLSSNCSAYWKRVIEQMDFLSKQICTHRNVMHLVWRGCQTLLYPGRAKTSCGRSCRTTLCCRQVQQLLHRFWVTGSSLSNRYVCLANLRQKVLDAKHLIELACNSHEQTQIHTLIHIYQAGTIKFVYGLSSDPHQRGVTNQLTNFSRFYCSQWFPCISPFEHPLEKERDIVLCVGAESISGVKWQVFWLTRNEIHAFYPVLTCLVAALYLV